jgi:hypothetical protein
MHSGNLTVRQLRPANAGVFSRRQTCQGAEGFGLCAIFSVNRVLPSQLRLATLRHIGIVRHFVECLLVPHGPEALVAGGA